MPEIFSSRPYLSLCLAVSLDGKISSTPGGPPDFTSRDDRYKLFRLRAESDALLIGANTVRQEKLPPWVRQDDLRESREAKGLPKHPAAIIVSSSLDLPWDHAYFTERQQRMVILTSKASDEHKERIYDLGLELIETGETLSLTKGFKSLKTMGFKTILGEGGGSLNRSLLADSLVDRLYLTIAPVIIGGEQTPSLCAGAPLPDLARFRLIQQVPLGSELHLVYQRPHEEV